MSLLSLDITALNIIIIALGSLLFFLAKLVDYFHDKKKMAVDLEKDMFYSTIKGFNSKDISERISSAILLRRFLSDSSTSKEAGTSYKQEAINIIVSLLRLERYGELQKTLADSIAYAKTLPNQDLQHVNLQDAIVKPQTPIDGEAVEIIDMHHVDLFQADVSHANFTKVDLSEAVFYQANLVNTVFHECNLARADFREADLRDIRIKEGCNLQGARFAQAHNIPQDICSHLDSKGIWHSSEQTNAYHVVKPNRCIFISSLGQMTSKQQNQLDEIKEFLRRHSVDTIQYTREQYRNFGQISLIRTDMQRCNGALVLGFQSILVEKGWFRPQTNDQKLITNQFISTPWNGIEAGMACGLALPIMIVSEDNIVDGLFDYAINDKTIDRCNTYDNDYLYKILTWVNKL